MRKNTTGFTIVELLIVIVVIAILAAITVVSFNGVQQRARDAKVQTDLAQLEKAVKLARISSDKMMSEITLSTATALNCVNDADGTDLAALPKTDSCWVSYFSALNRIQAASGVNVANLMDPYGRPYFIDENEIATDCTRDSIGIYSQPFVSGWYSPIRLLSIANHRSDC